MTLSSHYQLLLRQAKSLLESENDAIANAANLASFIYHNIEDLNWAGFYFERSGELVLGPFSGQVACTRIGLGKGVCGTAFETRTTLLVDDVHEFKGHIACDSASESEIVVPFYNDDKCSGAHSAGVLDIDSPRKSRFGEDEKELFESLTLIYQQSLVIGKVDS